MKIVMVAHGLRLGPLRHRLGGGGLQAGGSAGSALGQHQ